ncbi:hypothetical protein HAX54_005569 [Datura stramonium]|uniref:Uncharacterized protein n=1 Tax=Datura stramonium TaxID=4076 RepID=A0ABS8RUB5_DATST|nr:hypothetical protein [Datura stramonium]
MQIHMVGYGDSNVALITSSLILFPEGPKMTWISKETNSFCRNSLSLTIKGIIDICIAADQGTRLKILQSPYLFYKNEGTTTYDGKAEMVGARGSDNKAQVLMQLCGGERSNSLGMEYHMLSLEKQEGRKQRTENKKKKKKKKKKRKQRRRSCS